MKIDISIIIVNYCSYELLKNAIDSILEKTVECSYEIIIVDNNSPDNSLTQIRERFVDFNFIKIIKSETNVGFGKANNIGLKYANGRNVFFLNPDTILINNAIKLLSDFLDSNDKVGVVGGNLYDSDLRPAHSFHRLYPSFFLEFSNVFLHLPQFFKFGRNQRFNYKDKPLSVADITGADLMIKRSVLDKSGPFNPLFFMYYEETELCWRVRNLGYDIISYPEAKIQHLEGKCSSNMIWKANIVFQSRTNYYKVTKKNKWCVLLINMLFLMYCIEHIILCVLKISHSKEYWIQMLRLLLKWRY